MTASTTEIPELAGVRSHGKWEPRAWLEAETHPLLRSRNFYLALTVVTLGFAYASHGLRRVHGAIIILGYLAFVAAVLIVS